MPFVRSRLNAFARLPVGLTQVWARVWLGVILCLGLASLAAAPLWALGTTTALASVAKPSASTGLSIRTVAWGSFYPLSRPVWQPNHTHVMVMPFASPTTAAPNATSLAVTPSTKATPAKAIPNSFPLAAPTTIPIHIQADGPLTLNPLTTLSTNPATNTLTLHQVVLPSVTQQVGGPPMAPVTLQLHFSRGGAHHE